MAMHRLFCITIALALVFTTTATTAEARKKTRYKKHANPATQKLGDMDLCNGGAMITAQDQINGCSRIIVSRKSRATRSVAHYNRANALMKLSQVSGAIEDYGKALALNSSYAEAHFNRAIAYQVTNNWSQALVDLDAAITLEPNDTDTLATRGMLLLRLARTGPASADFEKALALNPRHAGALTGRAHLRARAHEWTTALEDYERALQVAPQSAEALFGRGLVLVWTGRTEQGEADMFQAKNFSPAVEDRLAALGLARTPSPLAAATLPN
jgi:tetratricopeptide (TPR) repeat protein